MTYIQKCEWLKLYQDALRRQKILVRRIRQTREQAESVTQAMQPVVSSGGSGDKVGSAVSAMDGYQRELECEVRQSRALCDAIRNAIWTLRDPLLQDVLELRYIDGYHLWQIANRLHISERHARRLHRDAVNLLNVPDDAPSL